MRNKLYSVIIVAISITFVPSKNNYYRAEVQKPKKATITIKHVNSQAHTAIFEGYESNKNHRGGFTTLNRIKYEKTFKVMPGKYVAKSGSSDDLLISGGATFEGFKGIREMSYTPSLEKDNIAYLVSVTFDAKPGESYTVSVLDDYIGNVTLDDYKKAGNVLIVYYDPSSEKYKDFYFRVEIVGSDSTYIAKEFTTLKWKNQKR